MYRNTSILKIVHGQGSAAVRTGMSDRLPFNSVSVAVPISPFESLKEAVQFLRDSCQHYGVEDISCWYLGEGRNTSSGNLWLSTCPDSVMAEWLRHHDASDHDCLDGYFARQLPVDSAILMQRPVNSGPAASIPVASDTRQYGLSFPVTDAAGAKSMVSVVVCCSEDVWGEMHQGLMAALHFFSHCFHLRVKPLLKCARTPSRIDLSPRERSVLRWAAEGMTAEETARLIGISASAVRLYISNAMVKLAARSKTQAVAQALRQRMIT